MDRVRKNGWVSAGLLLFSCLILMIMPSIAVGAQRYGPGVNLPMWRDHGAPVNLNDYKMIKEAGFESVRQPVSGDVLLGGKCKVRSEFVSALERQSELASKKDLTYIFDFHPKKTLKSKLRSDPDGRCIMSIWTTLAKKLKGNYDNVVFELLNEPGESDAQNWWALQGLLIKRIHSIDRDRVIFASAPGADSPWDLAKRAPYSNSYNVVYVFHDYTPMKFTHQGANWNKHHPRNVRWGKNSLIQDKNAFSDFRELNLMRRWKVRYRVPVVCDEFGVYRNGGVSEGDRISYLKDITSALDRSVIPWIIWQYRGGFGITHESDFGRTWDTGVLRALGLHKEP